MPDERLKKIGAAAWDAVHNPGEFRRDSRDDEYLEAVGTAVLAAVGSHTPTDDEREALLGDLYTLRGWTGGDVVRRIEIIDRAMAARRSEVPEPSGPWDRATACFGHCDKEGWHSECVSKKADAELSEPQGEPSDAHVLDEPEALRDLLDEMNEAGVMPELPFRDAQDIAGVAYLVDEGDTTRAVFLSDPGEDRVQYDGHSEDDASYVGLFEREIDELHGPITVLRAAGGVR